MNSKNFNGKKFVHQLKEDYRFIKGWIKNPAAVGAIKPTSEFTARHMAKLLPIETGLPVLELGPGTGVITKEILKLGLPAHMLISVEYSTAFYEHLIEQFPDVNFINGDAFNLDETLKAVKYKTYAGVIGAVPLLNVSMAQRIKMIDQSLDLIAPNGPFIQISYGQKPPVEAIPGKFTVEKSSRIYRNLPPAAIWVYRRDMQ